jgi:hypothetical protein
MRWLGSMVLVLGIMLGAVLTTGRQAALAIPAPAGRIAYQGTDRKLHVASADGGGDSVVPTRGDAFTPRWSPGGGELVYSDELATEPFKGQLVIINPSTGAARAPVGPEVRDPNVDTYWSYLQPRWTPDGTAVVYIRTGGGRVTTIMRVPAGGGTPQELFSGTSTTRFDLSPLDGRFARSEDAFAEEAVQGSELAVLGPDGTNVRVVLPRNGVFYFQPTWTPDGKEILVRRQAARDSTTATLVLVNPDTGAQRVLGTVAGGSSYAFSPDGNWLVVAAGDTKHLGLVSLADFSTGQALGSGTAPSWEPAPTSHLFSETGFRVSGRFLAYWNANGALPIYGYPLTDERRETLDDGKEYTVQYFERARFELHPEATDPRYQVLLGQFGRRIHPADPPVGQLAGATYFTETGHNLSGRFLAFWQANGALPQFGYPISEEFTETLEDGDAYTVQYFERARFEYHPEHADPKDQVQLGQFGRRILGDRR